MNLPKFPRVEVNLTQMAGPAEVGMCSRCGNLGEKNTLCRNPDCHKVGNSPGASSEDMTRASKAAYETAIRVVVTQLEARATALEDAANRWDQSLDYASTPRPERYAANVLRQEIMNLLTHPQGKTS